MATAPKNILSSVQVLEKARDAEGKGNIEEAAEYYEKLVTENPADEFSYDRLMIIYRKLKQYKDELRIINKGIRQFENLHKKPIGKSQKQQKLTTLSNAFIKSAGLKDKKGNLLYVPEPISRWTKRKSIVEKKMK